MPSKDLNAEIELLRKQLATLQKERESVGVSAATKEEHDEEQRASAASLDELLSEVDVDKLDLVAQIKELLDSFDRDIKDTKPSTLLIVFALGVLIGRLR